MNLKFDSFDEIKRKEFLNDLSILSGCPVDEIDSIKFTSGCVIFDGELDKEAISRLIEFFEKKDLNDAPSEIQDLIEFCEKWSVSNVHSYLRVSLQDSSETKQEKQDASIIFVHGWNGDDNSFGNMPEYVSEKISCKTKIYSYPTGIWSKSPSLEFVARNFDNWIRNNINSDNVAIVAHSMGGIIARRLVALQFERDDRLDKLLRQMTFIASPHNGAVLANIGKYVPTLKKTQLKDLSTDSSFLFALNSDWLKWIDSDMSNECSIRCMVGTDDKVVSVNSAMGLDSNAVPILGADHTNIVKPESPEHEVVKTTIRFLQEAGFEKVSN